ncbi:TMEM136 (predicted) [Pycnogonum litorale]
MQIWIEVALCTAMWSLLYALFLFYFNERRAEWSCRLVSTVHAVLMICMSSWSIFVIGPHPFGLPSTLQSSQYNDHVLIISGSYFLYDLCWCLFHNTEGPTMLFHHFASILMIVLLLTTQQCVVASIAALGLAEFSNPLLQLRWFLRELNFNNGVMSLIVDLLFVIFFIICRFGFSTALVVYVLMDAKILIILKVMVISLMIVSVVFLRQIFNAAKKTLRRYKSA